MIIGGMLLWGIMKITLGHAGLLGGLLMAGLVFGGIFVMRRKH